MNNNLNYSYDSVIGIIKAYTQQNAPELLGNFDSMMTALSMEHDLSTRRAEYTDISEDSSKNTFVFKTNDETIIIGVNGIIQFKNDNIYKYGDRQNSHFVNNAKITFFNGTTLEPCSLHCENDISCDQWKQNGYRNISNILIEPNIPEDLAPTLTKQHNIPNIPFKCTKQQSNGKKQQYNVSFTEGNVIKLDNQEKQGDISDDTNKVFYSGNIKNFDKFNRGVIKDDDGNNIFVSSDARGEFVGYIDNGRTQQSHISLGKIKSSFLSMMQSRDANSKDLNLKATQFENVVRAAFACADYGKNQSIRDYIVGNFRRNEEGFFFESQNVNIHGTAKNVYAYCNKDGEWYFAVKDFNAPSNDGYEVYFSNGTIFKGKCTQNNGELKFHNGILCKSGKYIKNSSQQDIRQVLSIDFQANGQNIDEDIKQEIGKCDFIGLENQGGIYQNTIYGHYFENSIINNNIANINPEQDYINRLVENVFGSLYNQLVGYLQAKDEIKKYIEQIKDKQISDEGYSNLYDALINLREEVKRNGYITFKGSKITDFNVLQTIERLRYAKYLYDRFLSKELGTPDAKNDDQENEQDNEEDLEEELLNDMDIDGEDEETKKIKEKLENAKKKKEENNKKIEEIEKKEENNDNNDVEDDKKDTKNAKDKSEETKVDKYPNITNVNDVKTLSYIIEELSKNNKNLKTVTVASNLANQLNDQCIEVYKAKYQLAHDFINKAIDFFKRQGVEPDQSGQIKISNEDYDLIKKFILEKILNKIETLNFEKDDVKNMNTNLWNRLADVFPTDATNKQQFFKPEPFEECIKNNEKLEAEHCKKMQNIIFSTHQKYPFIANFYNKYNQYDKTELNARWKEETKKEQEANEKKRNEAKVKEIYTDSQVLPIQNGQTQQNLKNVNQEQESKKVKL